VTWLRVDADMPWHDKVVGLPNDTARFAFVKALCAAKIRGRSTFTAASLREQLGSHARAIPALVAAGLLDEDGDMLTVHDFEEYQRKAGQVERQQRHRAVTPASRDGHAENVKETSPTGQDSTGRDSTPPPTPPRGTMMGFRPKRSDPDPTDVRRQMEEDWTATCGRCGVLKRKHPAGGDHQFEVAA
jgi:hypothetical protein